MGKALGHLIHVYLARLSFIYVYYNTWWMPNKAIGILTVPSYVRPFQTISLSTASLHIYGII